MMMVEDTDGVAESFDSALRIALTVAGQMGEKLARLREERARRREAHSVQETRELTARLDAERGAMRASLAPVSQPEWWDAAAPDIIAEVHETAVVWRDIDDVADTAAEDIRREVQDRYGINVDDTGADPGTVAGLLRQADADRARAREEQRRSGDDLTAAQLLIRNMERHDRDDSARARDDWDANAVRDADPSTEASTDRDQPVVAYDSAERRRDFAATLEGSGDDKARRARLQADLDQGTHPSAAVAGTGRTKTPARRLKRVLSSRRDQGLSR
jgi:hypothetical protein